MDGYTIRVIPNVLIHLIQVSFINTYLDLDQIEFQDSFFFPRAQSNLINTYKESSYGTGYTSIVNERYYEVDIR